MDGKKSRPDLLGDVNRSVRALVDGEYRGAEYAVVTIHLKDGVPDVQLPVLPTPPRQQDT